jgi:hypothetical protein
VSLVIESVYALSAVVFIAAGLAMAGMGLRAYVQTSQSSMLYLSLGFSLAVAGSAATLISAFLYDFSNPRWLLMVNSGLFTLGILFIIFSIVTYDD